MRRGLGKNLGKGYYNLLPMDSHVHSLSAKGVKSRCVNALGNIRRPVTHVLSEREFNDKFEGDYEDYEIGYATTKIFPNGEVHVYVKDSGDKERNKLLLMHELKEIEIFKDLVNNKCVDPRKADELAHNLNPVKIEGVSDKYEIDLTN